LVLIHHSVINLSFIYIQKQNSGPKYELLVNPVVIDVGVAILLSLTLCFGAGEKLVQFAIVLLEVGVLIFVVE
jgi:uncharacterized membrane protein